MKTVNNKVQLIGRLAVDPQITKPENAKVTAELVVVTEEKIKNAEGAMVTDSQQHTVMAYGKLAEIADKYLAKGIEVAIEGKLMNSKEVSFTYVQAHELLILTKR